MEPQSKRERELGFELSWSKIEAGHSLWLRKTKDPSSTKLTLPAVYARDIDVADRDFFRCGMVKTAEDLDAAIFKMREFISTNHPIIVCVFGYGGDEK